MPQFLSIHEFKTYRKVDGLDPSGRVKYATDNEGRSLFKQEMSEAFSWETTGYQLSGKSGIRIYLQRPSTRNNQPPKTMELSIDKNELMDGAYGLFS